MEAADGGQVHAEHAVTFLPRGELRLVALGLPVARLRGRQGRGLDVGARVEALEHLLDLRGALADEALVLLPERVGSLQGQEVFGPPVAVQTFGDRAARGFDPVVFEGGELLRIAFALQDRLENGLAGDAGQVTDDVLELHIHLRGALCGWLTQQLAPRTRASRWRRMARTAQT